MSKRRSWLCLIKRLFFPETHQQHQQKRSKRRKWSFGRFRKIKDLPSLAPPPPPPPPLRPPLEVDERWNEFEEDTLKLMSKCVVEDPKSLESTPIESECETHENHVNNMAAIKIQTSYRGYLARKALKALKGFVRLQAIIRGRAVRRQAMTTLKCLQAIVNIQSELCTRRNEFLDDNSIHLHLHSLAHHDEPKIQVESNRRPRLDDRLILSKEEEIDIILRKKEAILRRQRTKAYSFNHRHSTDSEDSKTEARFRYWLEQYVSDQSHKNNNDGKSGGKQLKLRNTGGINNPHLITLPRRSFHNHSNKQNSHREDSIHPSSPPSTPTYMAATESAKARTRSTSSPRVRPMHFESYSDSESPYKHKISPMSSMNSEVTCFSKITNKSGSSSQQKSPSFKGVPCSIRSMRNLKDVNLDSDRLLVSRGSR